MATNNKPAASKARVTTTTPKIEAYSSFFWS